MTFGSPGERARCARSKLPHSAATSPYHLRRMAGGLPAAVPGSGPRQLPAATFCQARRRGLGAILRSATILKLAKITGEGAARHT